MGPLRYKIKVDTTDTSCISSKRTHCNLDRFLSGEEWRHWRWRST